MQFDVIENRNGIKIAQKIIDGVPERRILPADCDDFEFGPRYGVPWSELIEGRLPEKAEMAKRLDICLKKRGVWTREDFKEKPQAVLAAVQDAYGVTVQSLAKIIRK